MQRVDIAIIGGGQAGLAMGHSLAQLGIDYVILERRDVADRWRTQRWDSLRLLSPNWMTRLPGWTYRGASPDGFMRADEVAAYLKDYARSFNAAVRTNTNVTAMTREGAGYRIATDRGVWLARGVVIATGHCDVPSLPPFVDQFAPRTLQMTAADYRRPSQLADGDVLVVGGSSSGLQIAEELANDGRPVMLSVGQHVRLPRRYRGRDIMWWLDAIGSFDETAPPIERAALLRQPSLQLVGSDDNHSIDLARLERRGVRILGRCTGAGGGRLRFDDSLGRTVAAADQKLQRLLARIDAFIASTGLSSEPAGEEAAPLQLAAPLAAAELSVPANIVWSTGYRRDYSWLQVPVLDRDGEIIHRGGITAAPGLYVLGLRFLRRRNSSFIDGVGRDATELGMTICHDLRALRAAAA